MDINHYAFTKHMQENTYLGERVTQARKYRTYM